jgi:hypothetical protein
MLEISLQPLPSTSFPGYHLLIIQGYIILDTASLSRAQTNFKKVGIEGSTLVSCISFSPKPSIVTVFLILGNDEHQSVCGFGLLFYICEFCSNVGPETGCAH